MAATKYQKDAIPLILVNDNVPPGARGMERYFAHVTEGIVHHFQDRAVIFSPRPRPYSPARHIRPTRFKGSEQFRLHDLQCAWTVHHLRPQLAFSAWFSALPATIPHVFVIYDLIYEKYPQYHSWVQTPFRNLAKERKRAIDQADHIIAISQSTARDLVAFYPETDISKVTTIYLGVDKFFMEDEPADASAQVDKPYFLYVGFRTGHKNFNRLLHAYGQSGLSKDIDLRIISRTPLTSEELQIAQKYNLLSSMHLIQHASDMELKKAYTNSVAFIYPSEYEGFGLPILEAMASRTIVATANTSSMPEIGGDVAIYFNPLQVESIQACLYSIVRLSSDERNRRLEHGVNRARTFTWEQCQSQTIDLLSSLLDS